MPRTGPSLWVVVTCPLLVWLVIDGASPAGPLVAVVALVFGLVLTGVGYLVIRGFYPSDRSGELLLVSPGVGLVVVGAIAACMVTAGLPLGRVLWVSAVVAVPGLWLAGAAMRGLWRTRVSYGRTMAAVAAIVGLIYFLPVSLRDAVPTPGGGFQWIYIDSVVHHAITSTLTTGVVPVRDPAFSQLARVYHFGPHATAATLVSALGIEPGDALVRVVRALGFLALVLGVIALGRWTAKERSDADLAGVCSLVLVFVLGGVHTALTASGDSSASREHSIGALARYLGYLPDVDGYKAHFMIGSGLWGMLVVFLVAALLVYRHGSADAGGGRAGPEIIVAPLGFCANILAGASVFAVLIAHEVLFGWRRRSTYAWILLALAVLGVTLYAGGFLEPQERAATMRLSPTPILVGKLVSIAAWFVLGLGIKTIAFLSIRWGRRSTAALLVLFVAGYVAAYVAIMEYTNSEIYAMFFLNALLGGFAAAPAATLLREWTRPTQPIGETLGSSVTSYGRFVGGFAALTLVIALVFNRGAANIVLPLAIVAVAVALFVVGRHLAIASRPAARHWLVAAGVGLVVFAGSSWTKSVFNVGWNRLGVTVPVEGGVVRSLALLAHSCAPDSLVATTHHAVPGLSAMPNRSYVYAALTRRYMLLEGWQYGGVEFAPTFPQTKRDNDTLFRTHDPDEALRIVRTYGITHLLTEPGTTLGFDASGVPWLKRIDNDGTVGIWDITDGARTGQAWRPR